MNHPVQTSIVYSLVQFLSTHAPQYIYYNNPYYSYSPHNNAILLQCVYSFDTSSTYVILSDGIYAIPAILMKRTSPHPHLLDLQQYTQVWVQACEYDGLNLKVLQYTTYYHTSGKGNNSIHGKPVMLHNQQQYFVDYVADWKRRYDSYIRRAKEDGDGAGILSMTSSSPCNNNKNISTVKSTTNTSKNIQLVRKVTLIPNNNRSRNIISSPNCSALIRKNKENEDDDRVAAVKRHEDEQEQTRSADCDGTNNKVAFKSIVEQIQERANHHQYGQLLEWSPDHDPSSLNHEKKNVNEVAAHSREKKVVYIKQEPIDYPDHSDEVQVVSGFDDEDTVDDVQQNLDECVTNLEESAADDHIEFVGASNELKLPHSRHHCTTHKFYAEGSIPCPETFNGKYCSHCYCYVCDELASKCQFWLEHCNAADIGPSKRKWKRARFGSKKRDETDRICREKSLRVNHGRRGTQMVLDSFFTVNNRKPTTNIAPAPAPLSYSIAEDDMIIIE